MDVLAINGWLHEDEQLALRRWCFGKEVLELGSFQGLSSCCIASTAKKLVCVDTFDGRGTVEPGDHQDIFWRNITAVERRAKVTAIKGEFAEVLPTITDQFDLIFIDGSHDYESVKQDIELAQPLLKHGGRLLMHDYGESDPGVVKAVDELIEAGAIPIAQANSLVMLALEPLPPPAEDERPKVVIGVPHRDGWALYGSSQRASVRASTKFTHWVTDEGNSVLTLTFNQLLATALNKRDKEGATHFAMLHNDIVPCEGWVDILMEEMVNHDLDFISAVVPLKNEKGLTSTATDNMDYPYGVRRLTMTEVLGLPETFIAKDIPHREPGACLLLNSGCTMMKLNEPWMDPPVFYRQAHDRVVKCSSTGEWIAQSISEDWDMSRQLVARGCRLGATRKVKLYHQLPQYNNHSVWGTQEIDEDFLKAEREIAELKANEEVTQAA